MGAMLKHCRQFRMLQRKILEYIFTNKTTKEFQPHEILE